MIYEACDLFHKIPRDELDYFFEKNPEATAEIDYTFLGFEESYKAALKHSNKNMYLLDLGCAYGMQSFYFRDYKGYIGIDNDCKEHLKPLDERDDNAYWFHMDIIDFCEKILPEMEIKKENIFAVCSAVPDEKAQEYVLKNFPNCFVWYPGQKPIIKVKGELIMDEKELYVKLYSGGKSYLCPLEDYLEKKADNYGYESYQELKAAGLTIDLTSTTLYDKEGNVVKEAEFDLDTERE